jgi:hypothetical protein
MSIALSQIAGHARDECHQQHRAQREANEHTEDVQPQQALVWHCQWLIELDECDERQARDADDDPRPDCIQQHGSERDL